MSKKQFLWGLCFFILTVLNIPAFAGIESISTSSSFDSTYQASNMIDGNTNTGWKAEANSENGWVELEFDSPSRVYQVELQGTIQADVVDILYFQNNQFKRYTAGTLNTINNNSVSILTNSDELLTGKVRLNIKGIEAAFEIKEIKIISEAQNSYYRKLKPESIEDHGNAPLINPAENAADGDLSTYWQANSYYLSTLHPENLDDVIAPLTEDYSHSAEFNLAGSSSISLIKLYFRENAKGLFKIYLSQGDSETLIFQTTDPTSGWMRINPSANQNITKIRITVNGTDMRTGGIAEAEFWGYGKYPDPGNIRFDKPQNLSDQFILNFEALEKKAVELQIATQGINYTNLQVNINQEEFSVSPGSILNGNEIYTIKVPASAIWQGSNYLEITGNANINLLNVNFLWDKFYEPFVQWNNTMATGIIDLPSPMELETTRVVQVGNADVNSLEYDFWNDLINGNNEELLAFNSSGNHVDRINIISPPEAALELYGSPSGTILPEVRIVWPPEKALSSAFPPETSELILYTPDTTTSVTVNGVQANNYSGNAHFKTLSFEAIGLVPRNYTTLNFYAIDSQAHVNEFERIIPPFASPILNIDQDNETVTSDNVFVVSGTIQPGYTLKIQGHSVTIYNQIFFDFINLLPGLNLIEVSALSNGAVAETQILRVIKTAQLDFEITSPENNSYQTNNEVVIEGIINGYGPFEVEIMGEVTTVNGNTFTSQPFPLASGENTIEVKITDQAATSKTKSVIVNIDSQAPVINLLSPINGTLTNMSSLEISGNINESNLVSACLKINGETINQFSLSGTSFNYIHDLSMVMDGNILIEIEAIDMAGNIASETATITLDTTPPDEFEVTVTPSGWSTNNQPIIEFASSDSGSGMDHYEMNVNRIVSTGEILDENGNIYVDFDSYPVSSASYGPSINSIQLEPLDMDGEYSIMVIAVDKTGNKTPAAGTFRLDRENPLSPSGFKVISGINRALLSWDDTNSDVSKYQIYRNESFYLELQRDENNLILENYIDAGLTAGTEYNYAIAAVDLAGNVSPLSHTQTIVIGKEEKTIENIGGEAAFENLEVTIPDDQFESGNKVVLKAVEEELPDNKFAEKVGSAFSIKRTTSSGWIIDEPFTKYTDLTFQINPEEIPEGYSVWDLGIYYWNETGKNWEHLQDSYYDAENNTLHATVHHFSEYQVMAAPYRDPGMNGYNDAGMSPASTTFNNHYESVSPQSGAMHLSATDLTLPGPDNFDLVISRSYSTSEAELFAKEKQLSPINHFAYGWNINLPWLEDHKDKKYLRLESGAKIKIEEWKDDSFVYNQNGTYFKLTHDEENKNYTLQLKSGVLYKFDEEGKVTSKTNRTGKYQITYHYNETNTKELAYIEDAINRKVYFQYDKKGEYRQITAVEYSIDNTPETIVFTYDDEQAIGKLNSCTDFMGRTTKYEYTDVMDLEYGYDITDSVERTTWTWIHYDKVYSSRPPTNPNIPWRMENGYVVEIRKTAIPWPAGKSPSTVFYDTKSSSIQKISLQLLNQITYPTGAVQTYSYEENKVAIAKQHFSYSKQTTVPSNSVEYEFKGYYTLSYNIAYKGFKITVENSSINDAITAYEYELNSARGIFGASEYLPANRYIKSCNINKDQFNSSYIYNYTFKVLIDEFDKDNPIYEKKELRNGSYIIFNFPYIVETIKPKEITGTILKNKTTGGLNQGDFDTITYSYHPATELVKKVQHARGNYSIEYTYDSYGNRTKTIDGRTGKISETFYLDPASNNPNIMNLIDYTVETDTVDNNSTIKTDFVYEKDLNIKIGKPSQIIISSNDTTTKSNEVEMTYTENGLLETKKSHDITTKYIYDDINFYLKEVQLSGFNVNDDHIIYDGDTISTYYHFYPDTGLLNYVKNNHNIITEYKYDKLNRLTDIYLKEGEDVDTATIIWQKQNNINDNDNIITATNERDHQKIYSFDSLNRLDLISENIPVGGLTVPNTIDNVFDEWGRLTDIIKTDYDYTINSDGDVVIVNNPKELRTHFEYDDLNRIQYIIYPDENGVTDSGDDQNNWTPYIKLVYTDAENRIQIYNENNELVSNQKSDWAGRLIEAIQNVSTENDESYTWNYHYNSKGNILGSEVAINTKEGETQSYQLGTNIYNGLGQLEESKLPGVDIWDAENEILKTNQQPIQSFEYDKWGNLIHALSPKMKEMANADEAKPEMKYNRLNMPIQGIQKYKDGDTWKEIITETFYNDRGQIVKTQNINENGEAVNIWKYQYNNRGLLEAEIDPEGNASYLTYNKYGNVTSVTDPEGVNSEDDIIESGEVDNDYSTFFIYNNKTGALEQAILPDENNDHETLSQNIFDNPSTKTIYDHLGRVILETDPAGVSSFYTYTSRSQLKTISLISSDEHNKEIKLMQTYIYDDAGRVVEVVQGDENDTSIKTMNSTYQYDQIGRLVKSISGLGSADEITEEYGYDAFGNLTRYLSGKNYMVANDYNLLGQLTTTTQFKNLKSSIDEILNDGPEEKDTTQYFYDFNGNPNRMIKPNGLTYNYEYDNLNRLTTSYDSLQHPTTFEYNELGQLAQKTDVKGINWIFDYYETGQLQSIEAKNAEGRKYFQIYQYDAAGRIKELLDSTSRLKYTYNNRGEIKSDTQIIGGVLSADDIFSGGEIYTKAFNYNPNGQLTDFYYPEATTSLNFQYNNFGLIDEITSFTTENGIQYDNLLRVKNLTANNNITTSYDYDDLGRLKVAQTGDILYQKFDYDPHSNIKTIQTNPTTEDSKRHYDYDYKDQLVNTTIPTPLTEKDPTPVELGNTQNDFTPAGTKFSTTAICRDQNLVMNPVNQSMALDLGPDETANIKKLIIWNQNYLNLEPGDIKMLYSPSSENPKYHDIDPSTMRWTNHADRLEIDLSPITINTLYIKIDKDELPLEALEYFGKNLQIVTQEEPLMTIGNFNLIKLDYAATSIDVEIPQYKTQAKVGKIELQTSLNHLGSRVEAKPNKYLQLFYNNGGNYTKIDPQNYKIVTNPEKGLITFQILQPVTMTKLKIHCLFDDRDNTLHPRDKASFINTLARMVKIYLQGHEVSEYFEYDANGNRVKREITNARKLGYESCYYKNTEWLKTDGQYAFTYDIAGNQTAKGNYIKVPVNGDKYPGETAEPINLAVSNKTAQNYIATIDEYDAIQFTTEGEKVELYTYTYDVLNRLIRVDKNGQQVVEYVYNALGLRTIKRTPEETIHYIYEGTALIFEKRFPTNEQEAPEIINYVYAFGKHFAKVEGSLGAVDSEVSYFHTDHLGSVRAMTDSDGNTLWEGEYSAFGELWWSETKTDDEGFESPHIYAGKTYEPETDLYYFNARWMDPKTGRFLTEDPIKDGLNWHGYVGNNPVNRIDPTGLLFELIGEEDSDPNYPIKTDANTETEDEEDGGDGEDEEKTHDPQGKDYGNNKGGKDSPSEADLKMLANWNVEYDLPSATPPPNTEIGNGYTRDSSGRVYDPYGHQTLTPYHPGDMPTMEQRKNSFWGVLGSFSGGVLLAGYLPLYSITYDVFIDQGALNRKLSTLTVEKVLNNMKLGFLELRNALEYGDAATKAQVIGYITGILGLSTLTGSAAGSGAGRFIGSVGFQTLEGGAEVIVISGAIVSENGVVLATNTVSVATTIFTSGMLMSGSGDNGGKLNLNKVKDNYLKNQGIDAHSLKKDILGKKSPISQYDIYVDKGSKQLYLLKKGGKGAPIPTGEFIN